jgi:hypothetical protein
MTGWHRVLRLLMALVVLSGIVVRPDIGGARTPAWTPSVNASGLIDECAEPCHLWLIQDRDRVVTVDLTTAFAPGRTRRVRYAADWVHGESCPQGRVEIARRIAGIRSGFVQPLLDQGFCPRATLDGMSSDAPYLTSLNWDDVVFDAERSRMLTREEYDRSVVSPIRKILASQEPGRWGTFSLFVSAAVPNADLLTREIAIFLADPNPSGQQETADGDSAKAKKVLQVSDVVTGNRNLVDALLNELDSDPSLSTSPGYRGLVDNLAGVTSSVPTWGSPPVCANVDRIARYLPWGRDVKKDATFLATLSQCAAGSENLLRMSLLDGRPAVVATGLRVWWAAAAGGHAAARNIAENVIKLVIDGSLPTAAAAPVYISMSRGLSLIRDGVATEEVALGLSTLGLLSGTIERLNSAARPDQAHALFDGLERGTQRLVRK